MAIYIGGIYKGFEWFLGIRTLKNGPEKPRFVRKTKDIGAIVKAVYPEVAVREYLAQTGVEIVQPPKKQERKVYDTFPQKGHYNHRC